MARLGERAEDRVLKRDARSVVVRTRLAGEAVVMKRQASPSGRKPFKRYFVPSRAARAWRAAGQVANLGIATPTPIAYLEQRWGPIRGQSWLITRHVQGVDARTYLTRPDITPTERRRVVKAIVAIYARLHAYGMMHGDNRPQNFMIAGDQVFLLDLDLTAYVPRCVGVRQRYLRRDWRRLLMRWRSDPAVADLFREVMAEHGVRPAE